MRRYLGLIMDRLARVQRGEDRAMAVLSDLRASEEPNRTRLLNR